MRRVREDTELERLAGYSRAARVGQVVSVSGTTANDVNGEPRHLGDTAAQTRASLTRAVQCVEELGGTRESVVRTRVLLAPAADWRAACTAHAEILGEVAPANSMYYVGALIGEGFLVEVEVDAVVPAEGDDTGGAA